MSQSIWKSLFAGQRVHFWIVLNVVTALDQFTKHIYGNPEPGSYRKVLIPGLLNFVPSHNPKGAFSLGPEGGLFYIVASFVGIAVILWILFTTTPDHRIICIALGALAGGALGNLIDRLALGIVRDFIDLHWGRAYHWPTFNVADMAICGGVALLLWTVLFHPPEEAEG